MFNLLKFASALLVVLLLSTVGYSSSFKEVPSKTKTECSSVQVDDLVTVSVVKLLNHYSQVFLKPDELPSLIAPVKIYEKVIVPKRDNRYYNGLISYRYRQSKASSGARLC